MASSTDAASPAPASLAATSSARMPSAKASCARTSAVTTACAGDELPPLPPSGPLSRRVLSPPPTSPPAASRPGASRPAPLPSRSRWLFPPPALARKESSMPMTSAAADATASPAPASCPPTPGPDSRIRRAARQTGHHWHSGDSPTSGGISVVAVSQTSVLSWRPPPSVLRTCPLSSLRMLLAPDRSSQRWKSVSSSEPGRFCRDRSCPRPLVPSPRSGRAVPSRDRSGSCCPGCSVIGVTIYPSSRHVLAAPGILNRLDP